MTRFVLVRHGVCAQTDSVLLGRALDAPLDGRGRRQAAALARRFERCGELLLESSPRRRARQTAEEIATRLGLAIRIDPALDEVDFGRWAGASFEALAEDDEWRTWNERRALASTPGGESMSDIQRRIVVHLRALHERHRGGVVALFTHAEIIRAALLHWLHAPLDAYSRYDVAPASCTTLSIEDSQLVVHAVNASSPALHGAVSENATQAPIPHHESEDWSRPGSQPEGRP